MMKNRLPFRLGTTSYILPADIIPNLRHLCTRVDDVELVLFESHELSNLPSAEDINVMAELAQEHALTFTVHLPMDAHLGRADERERARSLEQCRRFIERTAPLSPYAWILHLAGDRRGDTPSDDLNRWNERNGRSLHALLADGLEGRKVCVETLDYDFELVAGLVDEFALSVCLDIGHLLVTKRDVDALLARWFERTRVFHIHGVRPDGTDHADIGYLPNGVLEDLTERLATQRRGEHQERRIVTLEVFGEEDFECSMRVAKERLQRWLN